MIPKIELKAGRISESWSQRLNVILKAERKVSHERAMLLANSVGDVCDFVLVENAGSLEILLDAEQARASGMVAEARNTVLATLFSVVMTAVGLVATSRFLRADWEWPLKSRRCWWQLPPNSRSTSEIGKPSCCARHL
jgi:hypothetical protein